MPDKECLQANTEALTALEKRLQVVQQILDEVGNELGWLTRNLQDLSIGNGGLRQDELVQCMECDREPIRGLDEALRHKWSELMLHDGRYVGLCPDCTSDSERPATAAQHKSMRRSQKIVVDAEQFARAMESVEVLSDGCEALGMTCAECHAVADLPPDEAVQTGGWTYVGEKNVDGYMGLCPACAKRGASDPAERQSAPAAVATSGNSASEPKTQDEPLAESTSRESPAPQRVAKRRAKQSPLYMRMFMQEHMTALVRAVGHAGFPASEGPERMKPLVERFGESLMREAADEIVEIDHTQTPPLARLSAHARQIAIGLLGRPPEERRPSIASEPPADPVPVPDRSAI